MKEGRAVVYIVATIIGYLFGCVNMANILSKSRGIDIKSVGSNNAGASNVFISVGKSFGVAVGVFDILKAFCAAQLIELLLPNVSEAALIAGAMAVVGHIFPFWMKFSGGKGLAPFIGTVLFVDWKIFIVFAVIIAAVTLITKYIAIGTLIIIFFMPIYLVISKYSFTSVLIFVLLFILMLFKHTDNIKRLIRGEEIGLDGKTRKDKVG